MGKGKRLLSLLMAAPMAALSGNEAMQVLEATDFERHIDYFNAFDAERVVNLVDNAASWEWLSPRIPFFEAPDAEVEEIYYYRWWALRKHLKEVGGYYAYTEFIELETTASFIPPERTIASALGHHFMETRWLRDQQHDDSYLDYWMVGNEGGPQDHFHRYSSWLMDALWRRALVTGDFNYLEERFDRLVADYRRWQEERQLENGLCWQHDVWDAMEESISGSRHERNLRPTINSYMFGNAKALSKMAKRFGDSEAAEVFAREAAEYRRLTVEHLWNPAQAFFEVRHPDGRFAHVREAIGFIPWYFNLPPEGGGHAIAWEQLVDPDGFWAPAGLTTAERRHPRFRAHGIGTCEWDGAVWPFATSQTLVAMGNLLRDYERAPVDRDDYFDAFISYTRSQRYDGDPYIGEYHDEVNGQWLKGRHPRSEFYHHSTYADLVIEGLVGLRPQEDERIVVDPLLPEGAWPWFCLDGVNYRGHDVTILWDKHGTRYDFGPGFHLIIDGERAAFSESLEKLEVAL